MLLDTQNKEILLQRFLQQYQFKSQLPFENIIKEESIQVKEYKQGTYFGQMKKGNREGLGVCIYKDGSVYEGTFQGDHKHGWGFMINQNGSSYEGEFYKGQRQGKGRFNWSNGEIYDGEWFQNQKHGSGRWQSPRGDLYIGEWQNGAVNGVGIHVWVNGDRYEGQFSQWLKHGRGSEKFKNGDTYEGEYNNGRPSGQGVYTWANGSIYKGQFLNGLRSGNGSWISHDQQESYEGQYEIDLRHGTGIAKYRNGSVYEGQFMNNKRHGQGILTYKDGTILQGKWEQGHYKPQEQYDDTYNNYNPYRKVYKQVQQLSSRRDNFFQIHQPPQFVFQSQNIGVNQQSIDNNDKNFQNFIQENPSQQLYRRLIVFIDFSKRRILKSIDPNMSNRAATALKYRCFSRQETKVSMNQITTKRSIITTRHKIKLDALQLLQKGLNDYSQ